MKAAPLTLVATAILLSSSVLAHDVALSGSKHKRMVQVRQGPAETPSAAATGLPTSVAVATTPSVAVTTPTTSAVRTTSAAAEVTSSSERETTSSAAPTTSSTAPTTSSAAPTTSSAEPTTTSSTPTTTSTTAAPTTTSAIPTTSSAVGPATLSKASSTGRATTTGTLPGLVSVTRASTSAKSSASLTANNAAAKSGGVSKTATILIVIGVLVGVAGLVFFFVRKFKLAKTKKFNRRLQPLDFSAGGMPDEHEFKTTEGAFAAGEKRGDSDWERRERERSDLVATLDHTDPSYPANPSHAAGVPDHDFTAAYPSYPPASDAYGYPPQGAYGSGNGYEDQHHPTSYYGDNTAGFGAYGAAQDGGAGVQRQPSSGGGYDQGAYQQHDQYQGAYTGEQQPQHGVQRQPSSGGAYDAYGQYNYANTTDYPTQQPHQQPHQGQGGAY